jgi:AcrR family transcriptional regulator
MTTVDKPRERLLDAAADLFYREGVSVGVEAVCKAAGVSKRSMYQLFRTKDEVIAQGLARRGPWYESLLLPDDDDHRSPRQRILYVFERQEELSASGDHLGCPFVSTAVELKDPQHPASVVARRFKLRLTDFFQREAEAGRARDPETLAQQLTIVFDGASARSVVRAQALAGVGISTATALLDAAGLSAAQDDQAAGLSAPQDETG